MEDTGSTAKDKTTAKDGNQQMSNTLMNSTKPLHRLLRLEPRSLGTVILIFGCTEIIFGFQLRMAGENVQTSISFYIPFWQGLLFAACGNLSIYTGLHPSKKLMTVSLSMCVTSILGIFVSIFIRIQCMSSFRYLEYRYWHYHDSVDWPWINVSKNLLFGIEGMLLTSSLCVLVLLIILSNAARSALKSTNENAQVIVLQGLPPGIPTTVN